MKFIKLTKPSGTQFYLNIDQCITINAKNGVTQIREAHFSDGEDGFCWTVRETPDEIAAMANFGAWIAMRNSC
jgi:hypothetical protein